MSPVRVIHDRALSYGQASAPPNWPWEGTRIVPGTNRIAVAAAVAALSLAAVAASASAHVPDGQGLGIFGVFECDDPTIGEVEVFGAPAVSAANAYLIDTEGTAPTGPHVVLTRFEAKSPEGVVFLEKNFGQKAGLTTFDCTQTGEEGDIFTLTVAVVPKP